MIARGAEPILQARMRGMRPIDMVMVSLVGQLQSANPVVHATSGQAYDWRWAHNLDVCLVVDDAVDWALMVKPIALHRPDYLCVWHRTGRWGAKVYLIPSAEDIGKPVSQWQFEIDFLPWLDFQNADFEAGNNYEDHTWS